MAITQVANPSSVPSAVADYEAQNAHISAFNNIVNNQPFILTNSGGTGLPAIKLGTYIQYGGNLYVVDTEDYAITGTPVDGNNYIRLSGSTTLTAEWVQNISSYVWNEVYGYKESGSYFLLPYLVVKDGTEYEKYSMGAVTVQYKMNQNVRTTDAVQFASVDTGQGANELYDMNQNVKTTDSPSFVEVITTNGPNKPVDNNDSPLPTIGVGGFTYGVRPARTNASNQSFTLPTGGTYVYVISESSSASDTSSRMGRGAGGSNTLEIFGGTGSRTSIIAWRIA